MTNPTFLKEMEHRHLQREKRISNSKSLNVRLLFCFIL
ncbi:unnamed protein product [Spodoptera exigua]|nr:unnamed protein product [Spodoptera exigua]